MLRPIRLLVALAVLACVAIAPAATTAASDPAAQMRKIITVKGMLKHENALQQIADQNGGVRTAGTPGFDASVNYVVKKLKGAGYKPVVQPFDFAFFSENSPATFERTAPTQRTYVDQVSFDTMDYSGSGDVTADVKEVADNQFPPGPTASSSNAGCEDADFVGDFTGKVALIQRGTCTFHDKALNAQNHGAAAVLIFNEGQADLGRDGLLLGTLGAPDFNIPVLGLSFPDGEELHNLLVAPNTVTVHITTDTTSEIRQAANVLADSKGGDPNRVIVQGSHLDSVVSRTRGSTTTDRGRHTTSSRRSSSRVRASSSRTRSASPSGARRSEGLIGSQFYVDSLSPDEFSKILLNLNFDMIASPNYVRFVYDGDGSDTPDAGPSRLGADRGCLQRLLRFDRAR